MRRARFVFGSIVLQVAVVAISAALRTEDVEPKRVEVMFLKVNSPSRPSLPASPPAPRKLVERNRPEPHKPTPPSVLVMPRGPLPEAKQKEEQTPPKQEEQPMGSAEEGTTGGEPGGLAGSATGGVPTSTGSAAFDVDAEPAYATAKFRKPQMAEAGCVQSSLRVPEDWIGQLGVVTVKFAIGEDGSPSRFQLITQGVAGRIVPAIWRAVQSCRWIAGADALGRPAAIWVVLPIRFTVE